MTSNLLPLSRLSAALFSNDYHLLFHNQDAQLKALFDYAATQLPMQFKQQLSDKWLNTNPEKKSKVVGTVPYEQLITLLDDDSNFSNLKLVHINGKEQYVFIKPLSDYLSLASTGYLAIMVSKEDVLSSTRKKIKLSLIITAVCLILILPVSWFFASPIVGPIKTLVGENNKIKNRQFKQVSTLKSHIKEINTLAYSMVDMSKSIQQHEDSQKALMASFIELIAQAIDDKSPYTAGHCERVPELGIELAKAASESELPAFKGFKFKNDDEVEEIYSMARDAIKGGQDYFQVQAFPFRMTAENLAKNAGSKHFEFWKMLKEGSDHFELTNYPPKVDFCEKRYVFNRQAVDDASFSSSSQCPAVTMPGSLLASYKTLLEEEKSIFKKAVLREHAKAKRKGTALANVDVATLSIVAKGSEVLPAATPKPVKGPG